MRNQATLHLYRFGRFTLDTQDTTDNRLLHDGNPLDLPDKSFALLCILVKENGRAFNTDELFRGLRPDARIEANDQSLRALRLRKNRQDNVYQQIHILRAKLNLAEEGAEKYVETTPGQGYRLNADVEELETPPIPPNLYSDLKFDEWVLRSPTGKKIAASLAVGVALTASYVIWCVTAYWISGKWDDPKATLSAIQAIVIAVMIVESLFIFRRGGKDFHDDDLTFKHKVMKACGYSEVAKWENAKVEAKNSLLHYSNSWSLLMGSWFLLYTTFFLQAKIGPAHPLSIAATLFNNCNSLALTLCFLVLDKPAVLRVSERSTSRGTGVDLVRSVKIGGGILFFFAIVEVFLVFEGGEVLGIIPDDWLRKADWFSGIAGAIAMALYVGRGQSRFLGHSPWLHLAFYFYAAIQPLYVLIESPIAGALIIGAALILKCLLYLHVAWLVQSGRLLFYFVRVRPLYERVNEDWKHFLLILGER